MNDNRLVLRVDAQAEAGLGHLMRCIALAEAWRRAGGLASFLVSDPAPAIGKLLASRQLPLLDLACVSGGSDAERTRRYCRQRAANWLVVDGYQFDASYLAAVRQPETSVLLIDDLAQFDSYPVDVVVNQNLSASPSEYHVARGTRVLCGSRYALLRPEFNALADVRPREAARPKRVLVLGGGADVGGFCRRIVAALARHSTPLHVRCALGPAAARSFELPAGGPHRVEIVDSPANIAPYMRWADVAISAAGVTGWELARLGVPTLLVTVAANQRPNARALAAQQAAVDLGELDQLDEQKLCAELAALLASPARRAGLSAAARDLIDGCGAQRVVAAMLAGTCRLRDARHTDAQLVWHWANDPDVRKVSFFSHVISWPEHAAWFRRRLAQRDSPYYIAIDGYGRPWGQIRFDRQGSDAILSILLAPAARGQNRSVRLVQAACRRMFQCTDIATITALVITHNERSLRLFSAAGFTEMGEIVCHAQRAMRFQLARMCSEDGSPSPKLPAESAS